MNPFSPLTYYRRHKRSAFLLTALISLATMGLFIMVGVLDSIPMRGNTSYLTRISLVYPAAGHLLDGGIGSQLQAHPDVARVIPGNGLHLAPWLFTLPIPLTVIAVTAIAMARTLSKLDPVSIVERR